jgi:hypothetical protein
VYEYPGNDKEESNDKGFVKEVNQINLQKVIWYVLVGLLMALSSGATALTKTVINDHTSIAVLTQELHQLHQDLEEVKDLLRKK